MADAIQVAGLRFAYPPLSAGAAAPWTLDGLDLRVAEGEWLAIVGANDAGKTTLCLLLAGLAPGLTGGTLEGQVVVAGLDTRDHPPPALADRVGLVFQEPEAQLFAPSVELEVAWGLENLGLPRAEIRTRVDEALALFHLEHARSRPPGRLSGGEKKRLALASALAMRPSVLVLDEPMGGLDPAGRDEVLGALTDLRRSRSATIVMTESDPEAVAAFADRVAVLNGGRFALEGTPHGLYRHPDRLAALGVAVPQMAHLAAALNARLNTAFDFCSIEEARAALLPFLPGPGGSEAAVPAEPPVPSPGSEQPIPALEVEGLWFWYAEGEPVLRGLDLAVPQGQTLALVGANGSGKTTLVKHLNGLLRPRRGRVRVHGEATDGRSIGELARKVGFLFQHPEQQIFSPTVWREVAFGPGNLGLAAAELDGRVDAALARFGLTEVADRPPAVLSYGLRRKVTLASLAAMDPPVVVLDEPTVGLDARGRAETARWLRELRRGGHTVVLVTHDMALAAEHADRLVVLSQGEVLADGPPAGVFAQPHLLARASLAPPPVMALALALPVGTGLGNAHGSTLSVEGFCDAWATLPGRAP